MNYSLLPENERIILRKEYRIRAGIVLCVVLSIAVVIGTVSLFPAYVHTLYATSQTAALASTTTLVSDAEYARMKADLAVASTQLALVGPYVHAPAPSSLIEQVIRLRDTVRIQAISFTSEPVAADARKIPVTIVIRGIAPTRDALLSFRDRLAAVPETKVTLPLSELTKSIDVPFSLTVQQTISTL